jgi:SAM-dependent methyltransferase
MPLATRARQQEQMDDPSLDPSQYEKVLRDLSRINRLTLAARPTLSFLTRALRGRRRFTLLDVGFGHGDMLRRIAYWAGRRGLSVELSGVDLNPRSEDIARASTPRPYPIRYRTGDYAEERGPFDFIVSSLVAHHMTDAELQSFIRYMERHARLGWMINDLHRHGFSYTAYPWLARFARVHRIVREDGRLSIARAFRPPEWQAILDDAGVPEGSAGIVRYFPFRLCVERLF